jgi:hypothetical protein
LYRGVSKCGIFANSKLREILKAGMFGISGDKNIRNKLAFVLSNYGR